jgi:hypothetical protein
MYKTSAHKPFHLALIILVCMPLAFGKEKPHCPDPAWEGITARGRMLAEYDVAAWHASDAVMALNPKKGTTTGYVAQKTDSGWVVAFGRLNDSRDKLLIVYLATQGATPQEFKAVQNVPFQEDGGFLYLGFKAMDTCRRVFQGENRPYNSAVLAAESGQMYVYFYPAQTKDGIYPLGGDVRYLVSPDGSAIIEKRQLHKSILEFDFSKTAQGAKPEASFHTHVLTDIPEDTDVFYVLSRKPALPEFIGVRKRIYIVSPDGTISVAK